LANNPSPTYISQSHNSDHPYGFYARPNKSNIFEWNVGIPGKDGTIWEGAEFPLLVKFPKEYPAKPPHVRFISQIRHPNIFDSGDICLDILKDKWSPSLSVAQVLLGIQSLLDNPNVYDPTDYQLAQMYQKNREEYNKIVKVYVQKNLRE